MKSETHDLSDSQYMKMVEGYKDKHKKEMNEINKLVESAEKQKQKKQSWFSKLKSMIGL